MKKHLLGFALFSLIVGVTVAAAAYYFKMSKPLNEIPAVNLSGEQNYKSNLSGKSAGQSVIVDLKAKKVFTEVNLANYKDRHLIDSLITEIYEAGSNKHIFSTTSENDQNHNSEIYFSARFNPNRGINRRKIIMPVF